MTPAEERDARNRIHAIFAAVAGAWVFAFMAILAELGFTWGMAFGAVTFAALVWYLVSAFNKLYGGRK